MFTPKFQTHVKITGPGGTPTSVNPKYCLTEKSAHELAKLLTGQKGLDGVPMIVSVADGPPLGLIPAHGISEDAKVPYLVFQDGPDATGDEAKFSRTNAGLIADIWTHNASESQAMKLALHSIAWDRYQQNPDRNPLPSA